MDEWEVKRGEYLRSLACGVAVLLVVGCHDAAREEQIATLQMQLAQSNQQLREARRHAATMEEIANIQRKYAKIDRDNLSALLNSQPVAPIDGTQPSTSRPASIPVQYVTPSQRSETQEGPHVAVMGAERDSTIRDYCRKEWGTDFRMRESCETQQTEAKGRINSRTASSSGVWSSDFDAIRQRCQSEWIGDSRMQDSCESQQIEAWKRLQK